MIEKIKNRFRGFLPVAVDVETSGLDCNQHAILEIAAISLDCTENLWHLKNTYHQHVLPFPQAKIDATAMSINRIDLNSKERSAVNENDMLFSLKQFLETEIQSQECKKAILVGHNAHFDLNFINSATQRSSIEVPFHKFSTLDTVSFSALFFKETVLAKALFKSGIGWNPKQAHSALYDTRKTAQLFCKILNEWDKKIHLS